MKYRRFGRTELQMPVFSCGGMRFQQDWTDMDFEKITAENQAKLESCIQRSLEVGINHIETARGYGSSEVQLGQILPRLPREKLIVQTKISPAPAEEFLKTFETCMDRLKLDHVDLLSFHGINNQALLDLTLKKGGALEAGRKLQAEGRVRFLGYSTHGACEVITDANNTGEFDYLNLHWYWVNQVNWPAIEAATRNDMGVFIISPNDKGGKLYEPPEKLRRLCEPYSPMIFNDLFCLRRPEVHTLSLGVARPSGPWQAVQASTLEAMEPTSGRGALTTAGGRSAMGTPGAGCMVCAVCAITPQVPHAPATSHAPSRALHPLEPVRPRPAHHRLPCAMSDASCSVLPTRECNEPVTRCQSSRKRPIG
jgi:predicted aldo/keto reductase-like oxidoreductase